MGPGDAVYMLGAHVSFQACGEAVHFPAVNVAGGRGEVYADLDDIEVPENIGS